MNAPRLEPSEFAAYFEAIHGAEPFPWQRRLAEMVFENGWPQVLDVPTGAGKTAAIDVAVFHLALEATGGHERRAPVRTLFVVDRRLVVDDAYRRACRIASELRKATDGVLKRVADRLRLLSETAENPLVVTRLRGGAPKDPDWVRTPAQPAVIVSTVDQAGSRLFFRGYGVSDSMKPVHAGLLGSDALLLLDEAHLSQPFVQTARDSRAYQEHPTWSTNAAPAPFQVVSLSATPSEPEHVAALVRKDDHSHAVLGPRLTCTKPADLVLVKAPTDDPAFVAAFVERAWSASRIGGGPAIAVGIVVNRVRRARQVYDGLRKMLEQSSHTVSEHLALLIGRSRPLDRDRWLADLLPRMASEQRSKGDERPLFVVATQCIEAGADLDFDALITEAAPLDCLRQRFGRLNRTGRNIEIRAAIIASESQIAARAKPDPVYGEAIASTWRHLEQNAMKQKAKNAAPVIDFGLDASRRWLPEGEELLPLLAPRTNAPVLLPAYVDQWSCTSPLPAVDAEIELFLHGPRSGPAEVQIVWRADLDEADRGAWRERVGACPPSTLEAVSVPFVEAVRWLRSRADADVADVESSAVGANDADELKSSGRWVLRWRGIDDEGTAPITAARLRPGDLLVAPSTYGGCDEWGWSPSSTAPVSDLGEEANRAHRGLDILRLAPSIALIDWQTEGADALAARRADSIRNLLENLSDATKGEVIDALSGSDAVPPRWKRWLDDDANVRLVVSEDGLPLALSRRVRPMESVGEATTEADDSSSGLRAILLPDHSGGVRDVALDFARKAGLPERVAQDVALAAYLHDAGKAHPQFKLWLYGGDELAAFGPALAKSGRVSLGKAARSRAGLPTGARHELASIYFAMAHPRLRQASDPDLVLWLVGTHHGYGRPFFPAVDWPAAGATFEADLGDGSFVSHPVPPIAELTARWAELHSRLVRRYGPWGLAWLEAIVRLADHRRSEAEQRSE